MITRDLSSSRPISPKLHGALDYGFLATMLTAPSLLRLDRRARLLFAAMGAAQGTLNAFTDQPLSVKRLVPFRTHGLIEKANAPTFVLLPLLTGVLRDPRARAFFAAAGVALVAVYNLTDWDAPNTDV